MPNDCTVVEQDNKKTSKKIAATRSTKTIDFKKESLGHHECDGTKANKRTAAIAGRCFLRVRGPLARSIEHLVGRRPDFWYHCMYLLSISISYDPWLFANMRRYRY